MLKLKMMLCVMMLPLVVVVRIKAVCQSVREAASGVDNATSDWQTPLNGMYFTLREADLLSVAGRNPKYINEQCR